MCTRCGTLRREIFDEVGGFDEHYIEPSIEDYDLSVRILKRYRFVWDVTLVNRHYFPENLSTIFKRYHRNTRDMVGLLRKHDASGATAFNNDRRARFFFGISGLLFLFALVYVWSVFLAVFTLLAGTVARMDLFSLFYRRKGPMFCVAGIVVYILTSIPIATGLVAGHWRRVIGS
jgi:hypothetical protein